MPMKPIVYIDPQSYKNLAIYDHSLLSNLEGKIHYLCSTNYDYLPLPPEVEQHKIFCYNNKKSNLVKVISYLWSYFRIFFMLLKWQPQVIHLQWLRLPTFDVLCMKRTKRVTGCKIVFTAHNILPHKKGDSTFDFKEDYRKMYQLADAVIVHTQSTKTELQSTFNIAEGKVHVINHGLLNITYDPILLKQQEKQFNDHYMTENCFIFSALGFQYDYKGVDLLVEMWKNTPEFRDNTHYKLLLIGKNRGVDLSAADGIENIIVEDREVSDEEFYYLLTHTDVYVMPYKRISQSGALMSTITTGTPMLVTETGGLTEPFEIAQIGLTIPDIDTTALREKMLWLVKHPEEINKVRDNHEAWEKVRNHYSWENIGRQTLLLYHHL